MNTVITFEGNGIQPKHDHCPLCVGSMVLPKNETRKPVILFLDMDGVLSDRFKSPFKEQIPLTLNKLFPNIERPTHFQWTVAKAKHLHPTALKNLHQLISRIESSGQRALVVLSSGWRNDATLQQHREEVFVDHTFCQYFCGKTAPHRSDWGCNPEYAQGFRFDEGAKKAYNLVLKSRADLIEFWLRDHGFDPASTNFAVIDDAECGLRERFGKRFVHVSGHDVYFKEKYLKEALNVLNIQQK